MSMPGSELARKAEQTGNRVEVPLTRRLGLGEVVRQTMAQVKKDRCKPLPVISPSAVYLRSCHR